MPKLRRFSTPAALPDAAADAWSARVAGLLADYVDGSLPQFYDPTKKNTPAGTPEPMLSWAAFPATLRVRIPNRRDRLLLADRDRGVQDEYCEWTVERNQARKITRIIFTTEVPEYWEHLFETDPDGLVVLYRQFVDPSVKLADLRTPSGTYRRDNRWNTSKPGRLAHLIQRSNNLFAAIDLVAKATVLREKEGRLVTNSQELVACAGLGEPLRGSDPQIASAVNVAAGQGNEITLADPIGLYLGKPLTAGMVTPDGTDAAEFWTIDRGDAEQTLRARFEVPGQKKYVVGDITIGGRPIEFGGQVAERVMVWVKAAVKKGNHKQTPQPCGT